MDSIERDTMLLRDRVALLLRLYRESLDALERALRDGDEARIHTARLLERQRRLACYHAGLSIDRA